MCTVATACVILVTTLSYLTIRGTPTLITYVPFICNPSTTERQNIRRNVWLQDIDQRLRRDPAQYTANRLDRLLASEGFPVVGTVGCCSLPEIGDDYSVLHEAGDVV